MSELTFDAAMKRLQEITNDLEKTDLPLEQAIALFEEGLQLSSFCSKQLSGFETKINQLMETYHDEAAE